MSASPPVRPKPPDWLTAETVFQRFEEAWQERPFPSLVEFLPQADHPERIPVLLELIKIDLEYRWRQGEQALVESYVSQFPELGGKQAFPLELLSEEVRVRRDHGKSLRLSELAGRFPERADELAMVAGDDAEPAVPGSELRGTPMSASAVPRRLGRYEVREPLGRGGFGAVYRGWDPQLQRDVAIKVPHVAWISQHDSQTRALREAQSAARLRHPGIVPIYEVGQEDGALYIVSAFVPGSTLAQVFRETMPAPSQVALWVADLAEAVDYAHRAGIVHRDIKPANVLMDKEGRPMLTDFGLARHMLADETLTQEGDLIGTLAYMSPEQAEGKGHEADSRSDVYSLGVVLYEGLCGQVPFAGSGVSVLRRIRDEEPRSLRQLKPGIPLDLETICLKALAKEPSRRYATATGLADDLRRFLHHEPIAARRIGPLGRASRWCRRKPALAASWAVAVLVVGVVAGFSYREVLQERDRFRQERDRAEEHLYDALIGQATAELRGRGTGWYWKALDKIQQAGTLDVPARNVLELRDLALRCMSSSAPCFRLHGTWSGHTSDVLSVDFSADGHWVASASKESIVLWKSGTRVAIVSAPTMIRQAVLDPEQRFLAAVAADGKLRLWDLERLQRGDVHLLQELPLPGRDLRALATARQGGWLAVGDASGVIHLLERSRGDGSSGFAIKWSIPGHAREVTRLELSLDGKLLVSCSGTEKSIRAWDVRTGQQAHSWTTNDSPSSVTFAGTNDRLAWSSIEAMGFGRFSFRDQQQLRDHTGAHSDLVRQVALCQSRLLTASRDGTLKLWEETTAVAEARGDFLDARCIAVGPDPRWIISGHSDGGVRLWELAQSPYYLRLGLHNDFACLKQGHTLISQNVAIDFSDPQQLKNLRWDVGSVVGFCGVAKDDELIVLRADQLEGWKRSSTTRLWSKPLAGHVLKKAAVHEGRALFAAGTDSGKILVIDGQRREVTASIAALLGTIYGLAWNAAGTQLAAVGEYGAAAWDVAAPEKPRWRLESVWQPTAAVALHADQVATSAADGSIVLRAASTGEPIRTLRGHAGRLTSLAFSSDGRRLASCGTDNHVRVWDAVQGSELAVFAVSPPVHWFLFDASGRWLFAGGDMESIAWDLNRNVQAAVLRPGGDRCGRMSSDEKKLLLGNAHGAIHACSLTQLEGAAKGAGVQRLDVGDTVLPGQNLFATWGVAASGDGQWLATTGHDQRVHLWRAESREFAAALLGHVGLVWTAAFSPDSRHLATAAGTIKVWQMPEGRERFELTGHKALVLSLVYHPTRPWLFSSSNDGSIRLWHAHTGKELGVLHQFDGPVNKLAIDPSGRWLAAARHDHHVALWDLAAQLVGDGRLQAPVDPHRQLKGHANSVWAVCFSADGRYLASGSNDSSVLLWETENFTRLATLQAPSPRVRALAFTDDGRRLGIGCFAGHGALWDLDAVRTTLREMRLDW